jgi:hypothetical protein
VKSKWRKWIREIKNGIDDVQAVVEKLTILAAVIYGLYQFLHR